MDGLASYPGGETKTNQRRLPTKGLSKVKAKTIDRELPTKGLIKVETKEIDSLISCPGDLGPGNYSLKSGE